MSVNNKDILRLYTDVTGFYPTRDFKKALTCISATTILKETADALKGSNTNLIEITLRFARFVFQFWYLRFDLMICIFFLIWWFVPMHFINIIMFINHVIYDVYILYLLQSITFMKISF